MLLEMRSIPKVHALRSYGIQVISYKANSKLLALAAREREREREGDGEGE